MTSLRALGFACLLVSAFVPLGAACTCGPDPSGPPPQETCDATGTTYDGVTSLAITSVERVFGAQGGMHTEIRFAAVGATLPSCVAYTLYVDDGAISSGTIRGTVSGTSFASRSIIYFSPIGGLPTGALTIEALGLRSAPYGGSGDAGPGDAPAETDAGSDAPAEVDAPAEADAADAG